MVEDRTRGDRKHDRAASAKQGSSQDIGEQAKRSRYNVSSSAGPYTSGGASSSRSAGPRLQPTSKAPPPPPKPSSWQSTSS
eukprot:9430842-Karenia_brevis.AAC.1